MRLPGEQDERGLSTPVIYTIVAVSALILIILACVLVSNSKKPSKNNLNTLKQTPEPVVEAVEEQELLEGEQDIDTLYEEHKLRAEDLDFWDMYEDEEYYEATPEPTEAPTPEPSHEPTDEEKAADGKHVQVFLRDGTSEWIEIDESLPKHTYDFTKMKAVNGKMAYYEGNKKISRLGVMVSADDGEVDFKALKEDGIDFVMLKVGARGYESGLISLDENFAANIQKAGEAGLKIGVYFSSQAVTEEEAKEEAAFVTTQLMGYEITYPVAYRMDSFVYDVARTDILDVEKKTQMVQTFLSEIEKAGYQGIIYADKDWLLTEVFYEKLLPDWEIWLTQAKALPDYPYQFQMWEYTQGESVAGINGEVSFTISFVDYSQR